MPLISVKNLSGFYENNEIFHNLNFTVQEGDYLCIIGENGSGKTTLMKILLGFAIKHTGEINYKGFKKKEIGWLPQKSEYQKDFPASVFEVVMSGFGAISPFGLCYPKSAKKQAIKNMELMDILQLRHKSFRELSGGQQQKVLLCRALCAAKKVLLLDEPVTALDENSREEMYELIKKLNRSGMAVIMISHEIDRAVSEAKHILNLCETGYFYGTVLEYLQSAKGEV